VAGDNRQVAGTVAVVAAASCWGLWSLSVRPAALPSMTFTVILFVVMGVVTLPAVALAPPATWSRRAVLLLVMNGVWDATNVITFFGAMRKTTVAIAVLTHYLAPVLVAVFAPYIDRERVKGAVPGAIVACAGLALVLEPWRGRPDVVGAALGTASAFAYAGNVFTVRRLAPLIGAARVIAYHSFIAAVLVSPFAIHAGVVPSTESLAWCVGGAILLGAIPGVIYVRGLEIIGPSRAAMLAYAEPLVAVIVGVAAWGEPVGWTALVGVVLIVGSGVYVAKP
jgi:drug/metabolite transporter (DMT)-like permease